MNDSSGFPQRVGGFSIFFKKYIDKCRYTCYTVSTSVDIILKRRDIMSAIKHTITDAEYEIMCILWRSKEKLTVADIIKELNNNDWTASTVATFMARLLKKGVISCDKKGKINYYFPVLKQSEYALCETETLLSKIYKGSVKNLVATLYENKKLSNEDMSDLKKMFDLE